MVRIIKLEPDAPRHRPDRGGGPLTISWQGRSLSIRHDDPRITPYSPQASRVRSAVELAAVRRGR